MILPLKANNLSINFWKKNSWFSKKEIIQAVQNISFEISQGESVAFLGPNGAGKSTTIKLMCGILKPTIGSSWIQNYPSGSLQANKNLGLVFGTRSNLWMYVTVKQSLEMLGAIYNLSTKETSLRIKLLSEMFEIDDFLNTPPNTLSLGERMRCEIVAGLIHKPTILLADEPTIGLDVVGKIKFRQLLRQWQTEEKTTVLLTSHDISDVEAICERAILINKGKIVYEGHLDGLKGGMSTKRNIKLQLSEEMPAKESLTKGVEIIENNPSIKKFQIDIRLTPPATVIEELLAQYKDKIIDISMEEINLETIIAGWYRGENK